MADEIEIKVPDIGGATDVEVIEILVKPGDDISTDASLVTLESDKASMEIPASKSGKISQIKVKVGDRVSEGDVILTLIGEEEPHKSEIKPEPEKKASEKLVKQEEKTKPASAPKSEKMNVKVPDIGGATDVDVIEIMVKAGDKIEIDQSLITLEGDKATMDIPSPAAGTIESIALKTGDKVSMGSLILVLNSEQSEPEVKETPVEAKPLAEERAHTEVLPQQQNSINEQADSTTNAVFSAGPSVRRMARELGVNLSDVRGSGRKNRITTEDIQKYVKTRLSQKPASQGFSMPENPAIDFSKFGETQTQPLNKIKRLTGLNVHRSWITIPHVTQFDEADITELEAFRKSESETAAKAGYKLTILAFVTKVVYKALIVFPQFNASLDASGENLIYKKYFNIGIAAETPNGLVVPVIKEVDQLSVAEIAIEMARLSKKAREKGLMPNEMSGGCFTISSLGGIGGTAFTPIVNSPEVAILGLSRSSVKPIYEQNEFKPRLMLPLSLSYDHRVIDGAEAARFTRYIADSLSDIRRILL